MKNVYYVIGAPVAHSLSPVIHNMLYQIYGMADVEYRAQEVHAGELSAFLWEQRTPGFNVTTPLKTEILPYLSHTDKSAAFGANTVLAKADGLHGYSTDAAGFRRGLEQASATYTGSNIVFIGYGAVTRALVEDARTQGAGRITILNRTPQKAHQATDGKLVFADSLDHIAQYMAGCDLLVNTTPLGMQGTGSDFADLGFVDMLPSHAMVCDLIYAPAQTRLLQRASATGHATLNGLPMLVWQAFYAFEKFFGILPTEADFSAIKKVLQSKTL